ncbi:MAG: hypothetical protein AB7S77_12395 [Desulfatirhabdiaceae bacterium]
MLLGLDFDNTLIRYDSLFHRVAREQCLIPDDLPVHKSVVRDYLRQHDQEDEWTRMQGEVYGRRIMEAEPFPGMLKSLQTLRQKNVRVCIVSHKTIAPYAGPFCDLHQAAHMWLYLHGFFDPDILGWHDDQIFFELTKADKVQRILDLGCTHYIDDLPEILDLLPSHLNRILFSPAGEDGDTISGWSRMREWSELTRLLDTLPS